MSTYNAHQDEFGFKEGSDYPAAGGGHGDRQKFQQSPDQGYGDQTGETFRDAPERMTGYGDTDSGVGGPKSGYGASKEGAAYDRATSEQTQFGLEGKTGYGHEGSDPKLGETDTSAYGAVDPLASDYDNAPRSNTETVPAGDGWSREDTSRTHGAKKDGLVNKIKAKMPGQHHTAAGADPNSPPKKGMMEKIKEKLPGHHGSDSGM
jgi:hypothetical protein